MQLFHEQLSTYKHQIDADISLYSATARHSVGGQYGVYGAQIIDAFFDMLERGGKRLRGALLMNGYQMCGGTDMQMIVRAATAIEMVHASLLILDDIQDRSDMRRGHPTVHRMLEDKYKLQSHRGDAEHVGVSLALNAMLAGQSAAQMIIGGLTVTPELRANALGILSQTMIVTAHGQTLDIMHELIDEVTEEDINHAMEWKTAYYSVLNPLCMGMVLAGAGCRDTDAIRSYALHTGKAFQITDDIIGVYGVDAQTGKSAKDDIREGKQTLLTAYALTHVSSKERTILRSLLGKNDLAQQEFDTCKQIIKMSGAKAFAEQQARNHIASAVSDLETAPESWNAEQVAFLGDFARSLGKRST